MFTDGFLDEPAGGRWLDHVGKGSIRVREQDHSHRDIGSDVASVGIEILAELHHIDTERTEGLTHLGGRLGSSSIDQQVDLG